MDSNKLPRALRNALFTYNQAILAGLNQYALSQLVKNEVIDKLDYGLYADADCDNSSAEFLYTYATLRMGKPSVICLVSALEWYHITDLVAHKTWILVPNNKRIQDKNIKTIRSRRPYWNVDVVKEKNFWVTSMARTIVDCFVYSRYVGNNTAVEALKRAVHEKKLKPGDVIDVAKKMGAVHRVLPYVEMLG